MIILQGYELDTVPLELNNNKPSPSIIALRSIPPLGELNVREQGHICGHVSTDIPIVPDRVGAGCL